MNRKPYKIITFTLLSSLMLLLANCGGGGGNPVPASYTGLTSQASITDANAGEIVTGAWSGGTAGMDLSGAVPSPLAAVTTGEVPVATVGLPNLIQELRQIIIESIPSPTPSVRPLEVITGDCSDGTADVTVSFNQSTGYFSETLIFSDYCDQGLTLSGTLYVSGKIDLDLIQLTLLTLRFDQFNATDGVDSWTYPWGTMTYSQPVDMTGETNTFNLVIINDLTQKTYWLRNYIIQIFYGLPDTATINGLFYDHDYGYCVLTTPVVFEVGDTTLPTAGVLHFSGANSQAKLTFNSDQTTLLEVDANNDNIYETTIMNPL